MNIQILDCTLRDGGYINNWEYTDTQIVKIMNSLTSAKINIIECGYLDNKKGKAHNSTLFDTTISLDKHISKLNINIQKVVMINLGDFEIENLPDKNTTHIDGIRLAFHKKDIATALMISNKIIDLGYDLYFQAMVTKNYTDIEFLSLIQKANELHLKSFYIVDSFGSMTLEEFQRYLVLADHNLKRNVSLGYHSHNNMQLAFSNAINMTKANLTRNIIIDSSIYGIGRGAGNLNTELITEYLNKTFSKNYNTLPLLEVIDKLLSSLMKEKPWGFSPAQYLSSSFNCHPNYATYLINKNTNHIVGMQKVLSKLPENEKSSYNKEIIEKLYIDSLLATRTDPQGNLKIDKIKKVLLIASGNSVQKYQTLIESKSDNSHYQLIALNHVPKVKCDYYLFSNQKRYDEFKSKLPHKQVVITSNIKTKENIATVLGIKALSYTDNKFVINVAIVTINYLISQNINSVELAGLDGYKINENNYNYPETSVINDNKALLEENKTLSKALTYLGKKITIDFITPSEFKKDIKLRILGVIPARYKSSRFEGKPLCLIKDIPMIKRTYIQAKKSKLLNKLVVATDNDKIKEYCESENIPVMMTSNTCLTGTDRIAEVAQTEHYDLYVNIQGDEPIINPKSIDEIVSEFKIHGEKYIAYNLYKYIINKDEISSDTIIKVITNEYEELVYMSRLGIPYNKSKNAPSYKKQVCVYGFTKKALNLFSSRDKTLNERYEDIEILRYIDMGYKVKMKETKVESIAVDIPSDILKVEDFLTRNNLK